MLGEKGVDDLNRNPIKDHVDQLESSSELHNFLDLGETNARADWSDREDAFPNNPSAEETMAEVVKDVGRDTVEDIVSEKLKLVHGFGDVWVLEREIGVGPSEKQEEIALDLTRQGVPVLVQEKDAKVLNQTEGDPETAVKVGSMDERTNRTRGVPELSLTGEELGGLELLVPSVRLSSIDSESVPDAR